MKQEEYHIYVAQLSLQFFNKITLDNNFDEDDPDTIIPIRLLTWHTKFEKRKQLKKYISEEIKNIYVSKELMAIAWHPNR